MNIKPFTLSVVVGSSACNARCPFCVSKMTVTNNVDHKPDPINWKNWDQTMKICEASGVSTILITSKGEPTLFPDQLRGALDRISQYNIPIVELQTNATKIADGTITREMLEDWFDLGLRIISISNVGPNVDLNREIYLPYKKQYIDLENVMAVLHDVGFTVRLATVMIKGGVDSIKAMREVIDWAKKLKAEQLTLRPVETPNNRQENDTSTLAYDWSIQNRPEDEDLEHMYELVDRAGTKLLDLPHGASIYDVKGQNVCITNSLTESTNPDTIRQLIYFPDGHLRYSWQYEGAILL